MKGFSLITAGTQSARLSFQSSELTPPPPPPHPQAGVAPPGSKMGGTHLLAGGVGMGEAIRTKGQTLWYSRYGIIPRRFLLLYGCSSQQAGGGGGWKPWLYCSITNFNCKTRSCSFHGILTCGRTLRVYLMPGLTLFCAAPAR
jgi:hypothetical protein